MEAHAQSAPTPLQETIGLGVEFWNDSCDLHELAEAVEHGAVGATSNPVIVRQAVEADPDTWMPVLDELIAKMPTASEDDLAWELIGQVAARAAALLRPAFEATQGRKGYLCVQVNPKWYRDTERMVAHAKQLAAAAPNIAIKVPATEAGIAAIEQLTACGVRINATVCFTVAQALACAEAVERGLRQAASAGRETRLVLPAVTLMVGRLDDHLRRVHEAERISVPPGTLDWAGVAVFKKAHALFRKAGYHATLLAAAYRHVLHWTELVGDSVILTMPYRWWQQFEASGVRPTRSIERPVPPEILQSLLTHFEDFRRAWHEDGLRAREFADFGPSRHTLAQFLGGYAALVERVRARMLANGA